MFLFVLALSLAQGENKKMHLPFCNHDNYILYFSFMQNFIFEGFLFVSFLRFCIFQTSVPWLVARAAVAGTFPPRLERKRIGWNQTLPSIWSTWNTALKRYRLFFLFWNQRWNARANSSVDAKPPVDSYQKSPWQGTPRFIFWKPD